MLPRLRLEGALDEDAGVLTEPSLIAARASKRPPVEIMHLGDYDHDGAASEFVLQVESGSPCGNSSSVVIGTQPRAPSLHAFTTVEHPERPLVSRRIVFWDVLRDAKGPRVPEFVQLGCGDHGSSSEVAWEARFDLAGLHVVEITYDCGATAVKIGFVRGKRVSSELL